MSRGHAIPPNASSFSLSTSSSATLVSAGANLRGVWLHQVCLFCNSSAAATAATSMRFGNFHILRAAGTNSTTVLPYPMFLPPGVALTIDSNDANNCAAEGRYSLL